MADNVDITAGSGTTIATDDVAGVHYQFVKLVDGTLNGTAKIGGDATNGLDVDVTRVSGNVTVVDGGGALSVDDGGGSLTVDGAVTATVDNFPAGVDTTEDAANASGSKIVLIGARREDTVSTNTSATGDAQALKTDSGGRLWVKLGANSGTDVGDVDVTSVVPGTGATNLGKAVDSAAGATDSGVALLAVRDDALTTLTPVDGDYTHLRVSSTGALHVTGGGGGTEYNVNDAAPTDPIGATFVMERDDSLSALTEVEGDWTNPRASANGALWVSVDGTAAVSGTVSISGEVDVTPASPAANTYLPVRLTDGSGFLTPGTDYTYDVAAPATPTAPSLSMIRDDALSTLTPAEGDWSQVRSNSRGALWVIHDGTETVAGAEAHDAAVSSNPIVTAGYGSATAPTATSAAGDVTRNWVTLSGQQVVTPTAHTSGGCDTYYNADIDEADQQIKSTAANLYGFFFSNSNASARYLKFYNATGANTTVGTTTPRFTMKLSGSKDGIFPFPVPVGFDTALTVACTTGAADNDTGAPSASDVFITVFYK